VRFLVNLFSDKGADLVQLKYVLRRSKVLENIDILFKQFENAKVSKELLRLLYDSLILLLVKYIDNAYMVNSIYIGWWVLSKYYRETDKSPIYTTSLLLHSEKCRKVY